MERAESDLVAVPPCRRHGYPGLAATGRTLEALAEGLGWALEMLDHLRTCFPPRAKRWEADLEELAGKTGVRR